MPVARIQIKQVYAALYDAVAEYVPAQEDVEHVMSRSFAALRDTDAYKWNKSFRDTVDRLDQFHRQKGGA